MSGLSNRKWADKISLFVFLLPTIFFLFVFIAYPVFSSGYLSFTDYDFARDDTPTFTGVEGYYDLMDDSFFHSALTNQIKYAIPYILMTFIGSLFLALVVSELTKGVVLFNIIFYLPMIIALSMAGLTFSWILHQDVGIFNEFLRRFGFESFARQHWFGDPSTALMGLVVIASWKMIGFTFIIFLAGIQSIPNELREAAKIDGANYWEEVYFIILPLLKPYLLAGGIWIIINGFKVFDLPQVITQGGPGVSTLTLYLYSWKSAFQRYDMGLASRVAYATAAMIVAMTWVLNKILQPDKAERF
mgnify:CR=1 FL=1